MVLFISKRKQYVIIGNQVSTLNKISTWVPQGSVLGTLLFLIYINHLHKCMKFTKTYHSADDTSIIPFDPDDHNTYKANANPKMNILMSEYIGQRRLNFLWYISMLYIIIISNLIKFKIGSKYILKTN